jgi:putative transposase
VIGRLLSCPPEKGQLQRAIAQLAQKTYQHPIESSRQISIGASTIERWYYKARSATDPIAVLGRKIRSDAGIRWSMSNVLLEALKAQYEAHPRWNVQLHYDNLVATAKEQPQLEPVPSYKTVLRCMRENGWLRTHGPAQPSNGQQQAINGFNAVKCEALKSLTSMGYGTWTFTRPKSGSWMPPANGIAPWPCHP